MTVTITVEEIDQEISDMQQMVSSFQTKLHQIDLGVGVVWSEVATKEEAIALLEAYKQTL